MKAPFRYVGILLPQLIAAIVLVMVMEPPARAQCLYAGHGLEPSTAFTPLCHGTPEFIVTDYSSSYSLVIVTPGVAYTFASSVVTDLITIGNKAGTIALTSGTGSVIYTAPAYDTVRFYTHANAQCSDTPSVRQRRITCSFPSPANSACSRYNPDALRWLNARDGRGHDRRSHHRH